MIIRIEFKLNKAELSSEVSKIGIIRFYRVLLAAIVKDIEKMISQALDTLLIINFLLNYFNFSNVFKE